jgi:hypothetical protein
MIQDILFKRTARRNIKEWKGSNYDLWLCYSKLYHTIPYRTEATRDRKKRNMNNKSPIMNNRKTVGESMVL